ncbi:MAG: exodeoxyribonuclease VII small subunit [Elusimicrobia bacterium RIFOXYC2_FULL_34_12]|nr:MAG: exodeoxyribonuclease VII small subunit [Elusimicrobia bacterium RIFOXYC2_FULL_34_12]OGS39459.1 MAG: exodeoxyribonuclease VII small subunit [Elusimicrobia bacterium RIFOXYD2_FULL_34_30]
MSCNNKDVGEVLVNEKISYSESFEELSKILDSIEGENVEIDSLALKVKRATELIKILRNKLKKTETEIKEIVKEFDTSQKDTW